MYLLYLVAPYNLARCVRISIVFEIHEIRMGGTRKIIQILALSARMKEWKNEQQKTTNDVIGYFSTVSAWHTSTKWANKIYYSYFLLPTKVRSAHLFQSFHPTYSINFLQTDTFVCNRRCPITIAPISTAQVCGIWVLYLVFFFTLFFWCFIKFRVCDNIS